jgi:hypothetical protein
MKNEKKFSFQTDLNRLLNGFFNKVNLVTPLTFKKYEMTIIVYD